LAYASYRRMYSALKFLCSVTLGRPSYVNRIPFPKRQLSALPKVLTVGLHSLSKLLDALNVCPCIPAMPLDMRQPVGPPRPAARRR
jgi:hypothetical protein